MFGGINMYWTEIDVWYQADGRRIDHRAMFEAKTILELSRKIGTYKRFTLQPMIIPEEIFNKPNRNGYSGTDKGHGADEIYYAPALKVFNRRKFYGFYYFWNCGINKYDASRHRLFADANKLEEHINTPEKYWPYDPESTTYKHTYGVK
jgi:hypothetical protein